MTRRKVNQSKQKMGLAEKLPDREIKRNYAQLVHGLLKRGFVTPEQCQNAQMKYVSGADSSFEKENSHPVDVLCAVIADRCRFCEHKQCVSEIGKFLGKMTSRVFPIIESRLFLRAEQVRGAKMVRDTMFQERIAREF